MLAGDDKPEARSLVSWWFVPDHIHGTSSSTLSLRHKRLALAVTMIITMCLVGNH